MSLIEVKFYTRAGCGLCEVAWGELAPVAQAFGVPVELVDIDTDPELLERFRTRIPVVTIDGNAVFQYRVDAERAHELLAAATARRVADDASGDSTSMAGAEAQPGRGRALGDPNESRGESDDS